jgi:hypothetical protein
MEKAGMWEYLVHSATEMFKTFDGYNMVINYPELCIVRTHVRYHVSCSLSSQEDDISVLTALNMYFVQPTTCNSYNILYYYERSTCFRRAFHPSSGAYKIVCAPLGIVMLSCCLPLVEPSTPAVDSRKA